jgi:hypothetical protein
MILNGVVSCCSRPRRIVSLAGSLDLASSSPVFRLAVSLPLHGDETCAQREAARCKKKTCVVWRCLRSDQVLLMSTYSTGIQL